MGKVDWEKEYDEHQRATKNYEAHQQKRKAIE